MWECVHTVVELSRVERFVDVLLHQREQQICLAFGPSVAGWLVAERTLTVVVMMPVWVLGSIVQL